VHLRFPAVAEMLTKKLCESFFWDMGHVEKKHLLKIVSTNDKICAQKGLGDVPGLLQ